MIFREFSLDDVRAITALLNDPEVSRWTSHIPFPYTEKDAIVWIKQQGAAPSRKPWAIEVRGTLVGCISHWPMDLQTTEVGYWIGRTFWGKGYATKALSKLLSAPLLPDTSRIAAKVALPNVGSQRVLTKCGFSMVNECKFTRQNTSVEALLYTRPNPRKRQSIRG